MCIIYITYTGKCGQFTELPSCKKCVYLEE